MNYFTNFLYTAAAVIVLAFMIVVVIQLDTIEKHLKNTKDAVELQNEWIAKFGEETFYHQMEDIKITIGGSTRDLDLSTMRDILTLKKEKENE